MTDYERYLQAKQGRPQSDYERYLAAKGMAAGRVQSPGVVAPTNPPPPSIRQGTGDFRQIERGGYTGEPMGVGDLRMIERSESGARVPQGDASLLNPSSVFTGLVSKIATLGERANRGLIRPVAEKHARIQDVVEPGGERLASRGLEYAARMSGDFAVEGIPGFANRMVNPSEYGSTIGGQVKEVGSGLIGGIKKAGAQIGEEIHRTTQDLGVRGEENPMRQVYHDLGADKTFDEAIREYEQDPSGWLQTAMVAKGLGQTGAGLVRGLKPRTVVPEKAPVVPETAPVDVPRGTPFEGPISISQAMRDAEKLTAIRKEWARRENPITQPASAVGAESGAVTKPPAPVSEAAPVSPAKQPTVKTWYAGHGEGKPTGKYLYVTDNPEYAKQFGEVKPYSVKPENTADFSYLGERSISRERAIAELKKKGVEAQIPLDDDVYKPMWQWVRKYPQIADQVKSSGFDSMAFKETFGGTGKRHNSLMILDESKFGEPPVSPAKQPTVGEVPDHIPQRSERLRDFPPENTPTGVANRVVVASIVDGELHIGKPGDIHTTLDKRIFGDVIDDPSLYDNHQIVSGFYDPATQKFIPQSKKFYDKYPDLAEKYAKPPVSPQGAAKQPWEMTFRESGLNPVGKNDVVVQTPKKGDTVVHATPGNKLIGVVQGKTKGGAWIIKTDEGTIETFLPFAVVKNPKAVVDIKRGFAHFRAVEDAVKSGKPVPPEVLADYPDLVAQGAKPPIEPPKPPTEQLAEPPEPQKGTPSLSIRTEADAIAKKLTDDFGDLPEYKTMNMQEQATRAKSLIDADAEQAKRIAMGIEAAPEGLRDASVYEAVKLDALKKGDVETLRQLAVESTVPSKLSAYGQEIKASDSRLLDDPVRVMQDVAKTRQEHAKRTGQRYTSEEVTRLKDKLAEAERKLSERIKTTVGKAYGAKNRIVSTAAYEAAKQKIKASLSTAHAGVPPELLVEVSKIGAYHLEAGTRAFADWSAKMIEDLGEKIRPNLEDIWKRVNDDRRLQISLKAQRTRFERETGKYQSKLEGLDFSKPEKRALVLDPETRRLKALRDVAKRNWEAALNSYSSVTKEEATNIVNLSKDMTNKLGELERGGDRLEYGAARVAYENYVNYLKGEQTPIRTLAKAGIDKFKTTAQTNKAKAAYDLGVDALKVIVNNSVSMVATLDNSFLGRQGLHTLMTHPTVWAKGAVNSFADIWKTLGGKDAHSALMADIYSRPNYLDGTYEKAGILAKVEEQYPSSLPERIPGVGRVFKASENAFTGSAIRMRTGLYDLLAKRAAENGVDMADPVQIKALGKMINALTARGQWGKTGEPAVVRLVMWAPKMLKGNIDVLTAHGGGVGLETPFARKQAAYNLLKIVGETATLMTIANAIKPGSAETDPRSSDFGKIKVGNTRYDITGGAASIVTLASRIATGERKSTNTGQMIPYGTKYGQASELDALVDFLANKTNPPAHVVVDWLRGRDFTGEPFSLGREAYRATTPIAVQQAINLKDDHSANAVAGVILDGLGVNATTYEPKPAKPATPKLPPKPKVRGIGPISQADIDSIPAHIQVKYEGVKSKSGEKVQMTGPARQVLKDLYAESDLYKKILESLT